MRGTRRSASFERSSSSASPFPRSRSTKAAGGASEPGGGSASGCLQRDGCFALVADSFSLGLRSDITTRSGIPNTEFMVLVLLMLSEAISDVSTVPGGWLSSRW